VRVFLPFAPIGMRVQVFVGVKELARLMAARYGYVPENYARNYHRWQQWGRITVKDADEICAALGTHIAIVYPEYLTEEAV
jgi:hypothetical protein